MSASNNDKTLPLNLNEAFMNQESISQMIQPCQIFSTEEQKLMYWQPFYYVDEQGNYRCKHCVPHKKFTTSKWLVHHLDKVAKINAENQGDSEESSNGEGN